MLVHGMCHGAWCWYKIATLLEAAGHRVSAPDLLAAGTNPGKIEEVESFADYCWPLLEAMAAVPDDEKVILVGHSLAGFVIALAMERFPEKVSVAVFVTAVMPTEMLSISRIEEEVCLFFSVFVCLFVSSFVFFNFMTVLYWYGFWNCGLTRHALHSNFCLH